MPQVVVFEGAESRIQNHHFVLKTPVELPAGDEVTEYMMDCLLLAVGIQPVVDHKANADALDKYLGYEMTKVCIYPDLNSYAIATTELAIHGRQLHSGLMPEFQCKTFTR